MKARGDERAVTCSKCHRSENKGRRERERTHNRGRSFSRSRTRSKSRSKSRDRDFHRNKPNRYEKQVIEDVNLAYKGEKETVEEVFIAATHNPKTAVIDSGCTKTVGGIIWYEKFKEVIDEWLKRRIEENKEDFRSFRFGNGKKFPSKMEIVIPFQLGGLNTELRVSLVDAHIPLLIWKSWDLL